MDSPSIERPNVPRWRRVVVAVLVVLGCILAPLSVLSVWMRTTLLNTDEYVATVAPLAHDPAVQNAIADRVANTLVTGNTVEQQVVARLPEKAKFVAPKIEGAVASFVHDATLKVVQSDQFATLWKEANRRAHTQVVALLEGKGNTLQTSNGEIVLQVGQIADKVNAALEARGIDAFSGAASRASTEQIVLFKSIWLKRSQNATNLLQTLAVVLPLLTVLCFGLAIFLSPHRRLTVLRGALGLALGMALLLIVFNAGRRFYTDALPFTVNAAAATAAYDRVLGALRLALRSGFVFAILVALAAWLAGPARPATRVREGVLRVVRGTAAADEAPSPFALSIARHKNGLRVAVVGAGLVVLVALSAPTPLQVAVVALVVVFAVLLIEFFARRAPEPGTVG